MSFWRDILSDQFGMTVVQMNYLLYLLFCSIGTNKIKKKDKNHWIDWTSSLELVCLCFVFFQSLCLCLIFFLVNVNDDVKREIFMRFPFMWTHSNPFIIYLAIKRICTAIQFIVSTSICYKATNVPGFKKVEVLEYSREP